MRKITEAELSRRVNSLREKLISEEIRPFGSHDESITRDPGVDPSISLSKMLPALKDVTRLTTHNGLVVAVNQDGVIRGVYDGQNSWKAGRGMPDNLQNVTVPPAQAAAPAADPVNGKTPEQAMLDPRYKIDPAFKKEVDTAAAIGTAPAAKGEETFNKITGKWEPAQTSDELDAVKKNAGLPAGAPAAAAPAAAPVATPVQSGGRPANAADMENANWEYAKQGSDVSLAVDNGFGYDVAAWKAAGSPGKPKPADSAPPAGSLTWDDPVSISQQDTLNQQMAQHKAEANGVNAAGQNVSIQNPDGSITNPESGPSSIAPVAAPAKFAPAASNAAFQRAMAPSAAPAYKGSAGAQQIQSLNKDIIKDVNKIYPGQKFKMPDNSTYTVQPGDTLDKIAKGAKPAGDQVTTSTKQLDRVDKAPPAASAPAAKPAPAPAASVPKPAASAPKTANMPLPGRMPARESVTYADDQTLARIVSLSRR